MLLDFVSHLRRHRLPISIGELLDCLSLLDARLVFADLGRFYYLSRMVFVKDEKYFDRFDQAFESFFSDLETFQNLDLAPDFLALTEQFLLKQWQIDPTDADLLELRQIVETYIDQKQLGDIQPKSGNLSEQAEQTEPAVRERESQEQLSASGDGDETALDQGEQDKPFESGESGEEGEAGESGEEGESGDEGERGEDGEKGDGSDGQLGLGAGDVQGQGIRDAEVEVAQQFSAKKIWQLRLYEDYDPDVELGTRNIKMALRRLRKFVQSSEQFEFDLSKTIDSTARNAGLLEIIESRERHNAVKVLLFLDVGGSMDEHIERCGQLFSAAKSEFKYLETFYFHNFIYESVWPDNQMRGADRIPVYDLLRKYGADYKVIIVGDASMARHEITERGGSVEHFNREPGDVWLARLKLTFRKLIWINPTPLNSWQDAPSSVLIKRLVDDKMYHLSITGLETAMKFLVR